MPGFAEFISSIRPSPEERGSTLEQMLARAAQDRGREPEPEDPDDRLAAMITRGYSPGLLHRLSQQLADTCGELEAERAKIARGARRAAVARREHEAGRVNVWGMQQMLDDGDFGDEGRASQLERRAESLRSQMAKAAAMIAPQQERETDPFEAATRTAHQAFREITRQRMAEAEASRPEPRPFASRGGVAVRSEQCAHCTAYGVSDEQSNQLHNNPERNVPIAPPGAPARAAGHGGAGAHGNHHLAVR
jgi:hypothetical protein